MGLKEKCRNVFNNDKDIFYKRYRASKFIFILMSFSFFLSLFLIGNGLYSNLLTIFFPYLYFSLLITTLFFSYFFIKKILLGETSNLVLFIIFIFILIILVFLSLPLIINGGINSIIELIQSNINF